MIDDLVEVGVACGDDLRQRRAGVVSHRIDVTQHLGLWETKTRGVDPAAVHHGLQQVLLIFTIHDRETFAIAQTLRIPAQQFVADAVKRAAPEPLHIHRHQHRHTIQHLTRRLVGERQQQDLLGQHAIVQQPGHAIGQRPRLARSCPGNDQRLPRRRSDSGILLLIELRFVINAVSGGTGSVQRVVAGHERE